MLRALIKHSGWNVKFSEKIKQIRFAQARASSLLYYPRGTVDMDMFENLVILNEDTARYLYSTHTSLRLKYRSGSRPFLEQVVEKATHNCPGNREKVLALLRFVRDFQYTGPEGLEECFGGGTEEDIIRKHAGMCNEQARVLACLWQIAGFPARYSGHIRGWGTDWQEPGGHGTNEVFLEGKWCYFDEKGKYCLQADGSIASLWELMQDPEIAFRQSAPAARELRPGANLESVYRHAHSSTINLIANYNIWDQNQYSYQWTWYTEAFHNRAETEITRNANNAVAKAKKLRLKPAWPWKTSQRFPPNVKPRRVGQPLSAKRIKENLNIIYPGKKAPEGVKHG